VELVPESLVREIFLLGAVDAQREQLAEFGRAGISTAVLALLCAPHDVPKVIEAFAPSR
jgi:hypothetical protein